MKLSSFGLLLLLLLLFFGVSSCTTTKKVLTNTVTKTEIKVDTVLKIIPDLKNFSVRGNISDTLRINNKYVSARSYYSVTKQKIVLELNLKPFDYPLQINKTVTEKKQIKEIKGKTTIQKFILRFEIFIFILTAFFIYLKFLKK